MSVARRIEKGFQLILPSPFGIAILLTFVSILLAVFVTKNSPAETLDFWQSGFWDAPMMVFTLQMVFILILGHSLAVSSYAQKLIRLMLRLNNNASQGVFMLALTSMVLGFFNWGLGLVFGAVMAREMASDFQKRGIPFYYPVLGAAGYMGMLTWHGGLSGSAPLKAAESGHIAQLSSGMDLPIDFPDRIPLQESVLSTTNLLAFAVLCLLIPLLLTFFSKKTEKRAAEPLIEDKIPAKSQKGKGAERIDHQRWPVLILGLLFLTQAVREAWFSGNDFSFITPNYLNWTLLGLTFLAHRSLSAFYEAIMSAMRGGGAIIIQFPFYFGIMGILKGSGLILLFSSWVLNMSSDWAVPLWLMGSAAVVNIFVPSGGGQWGIQGPLIIDLCSQLNIPLAKGIMAMAYGDQLTNMLQPFWALPLLAITGLRAYRVLPYTFMAMVLAALVFVVVLG